MYEWASLKVFLIDSYYNFNSTNLNILKGLRFENVEYLDIGVEFLLKVWMSR